MADIEKKAELVNVKAKWISLVDKAANLKEFAIIKSENQFAVETDILKADFEKQIVTAVVYTPGELDAHGDYMTSDEIEKAAHYFLSNKGDVDLQHNYEVAPNVNIVESWVTKQDGNIGSQEIKKGTWMASMKVENDLIWKAIKSGEITGFSMGGTGQRIKKEVKREEEMTIEDIKKAMAEVVAGNQDTEVLKELQAKLESEVEVNKANKEEIEVLKGNITKLDEALRNVTVAKSTGDEDSIEKSLEDYDKIIKDANLTTGASMIPKPLSNQMSMDMKEISPFFNDGRSFSATGTTIRIPVRKPNTTSSAYAKAEKQGVTDGTINIDEIEISKGIVQSNIPLTDELRRDSQFNAAQVVREYSVEDIAEYINLHTYNGALTGNDKIEGFTINTGFAARSVERLDNLAVSLEDLYAVKKQVKPQYWRAAKWYVSRDAYFEMKLMLDSEGRPLWQESQIPGTPSTFDGHPVVLCYQMDDEFPVLFADFAKLYYYFVDYRMESEMDRFATQGYTNEIVRARLGGKVANIEAGFMLKKKVV